MKYQENGKEIKTNRDFYESHFYINIEGNKVPNNSPKSVLEKIAKSKKEIENNYRHITGANKLVNAIFMYNVLSEAETKISNAKISELSEVKDSYMDIVKTLEATIGKERIPAQLKKGGWKNPVAYESMIYMFLNHGKDREVLHPSKSKPRQKDKGDML